MVSEGDVPLTISQTLFLPPPHSDQCFRCQLELFIGGNMFCLLFSESFQNTSFITETQMCLLLCAVCCLLFVGLDTCVPLPRGIRSLTSPVPSLESVLIKCASWTNSFLLISYFLRDFLFQTFSLIFIFTTIFLLLKCSVYSSPNNWISWWRHLRTVRGIENCCYHLN